MSQDLFNKEVLKFYNSKCGKFTHSCVHILAFHAEAINLKFNANYFFTINKEKNLRESKPKNYRKYQTTWRKILFPKTKHEKETN